MEDLNRIVKLPDYTKSKSYAPINGIQNGQTSYVEDVLQMTSVTGEYFPKEEMSPLFESAYDMAMGRAYANQQDRLWKEKAAEASVVSHALTEYGYVRGKQFSDGSCKASVLTNRRIVGGTRWEIDGQILFKLQLQDYVGGTVIETPVLKFSVLEDDKACTLFLTKYFFPTDSRVYKKAAIQDFRSRLFEAVMKFTCEMNYTTVGWHQEPTLRFVDGAICPDTEKVMSQLRKDNYDEIINATELVNTICSELHKADFENRLAFLLGFGLTACLGSVLGVSMNSLPGVILTGAEKECRECAEGLLKLFKRKSGSDVLNLYGESETTVAEYAKSLRDDCIVINAFEASRKKHLLKNLAGGRTTENYSLKAPLVLLQDFPDTGMNYCDFIVVDVQGLRCSGMLQEATRLLKVVLIHTIEQQGINLVQNVNSEQFADCYTNVARAVEGILSTTSMDTTIIERLKAILLRGLDMAQRQLKAKRDVVVETFVQRFRKIVAQGDICILKFPQILSNIKNYHFIWEKEEKYLIPAGYIKHGLYSLIQIEAAEFKYIRNWLQSRGSMYYSEESEEATRRLKLPNGERVRIYEVEQSVFK